MPDRTLQLILTGRDAGAGGLITGLGVKGESAAGKIGSAFGKLGNQIGGEFGNILSQAGQGISDFGEKGKNAGAKLAVAGVGMAGLGVALLNVGSSEKQASDQLKAAIEASGNSLSDYQGQIEDTVKHQEGFGHSAVDTKNALAKLTEATGSPEKALKEMGVVADLAAAKHISLADASTLVARVLGGSGGKVLAQYGVTMGKNADGTKNVDKALSDLATKLHGQASASVNNFAGKVDVIRAKLGDWIAQMGQKFGPALTIAGVGVTALGTVMQVLQTRAAAAATAQTALAAANVAEGEAAAGAATANTGLILGLIKFAGPIAGITAISYELGQVSKNSEPAGIHLMNLGDVWHKLFGSDDNKKAKEAASALDAQAKAAADAKAAMVLTAGGAVKMGDAVGGATAFLDANKLTTEQATTKWNDAHTAAYSLTAQLGYMSIALDKFSNNAITAEQDQLKINDALGTGADRWDATRKQVDAHGKSLNANTVDGRANLEWALSQITAVNDQAVAYGKATGSIPKATAVLGTNTGALRTAMIQAGFTTDQVDALIRKYGATPKQVTTSVQQQGANAVVSALGNITTWLHRIADPKWAARVDFAYAYPNIAHATAGGGTGGGYASGGLLNGPGGPTGDKIALWGSAGEYMVQAAAVSKYGTKFMDMLNAGKFALGGLLTVDARDALSAGLGRLEGTVTRMPAGISGGSPFTGGGSLGAWIGAALAATGTPGSWGAAIARRIQFESGGNPNAINNWDSNAMAGDPSRGLMQTIGSTFNAYHQPGTSGNIYDPVANIAAAINYIKSRYGSIFAIDPPVQGYDSGGWLPPGVSLAVNRTGRPERVTPAGQAGGVTVNVNVSGSVVSEGQLVRSIADGLDKLRRRRGLPSLLA